MCISGSTQLSEPRASSFRLMDNNRRAIGPLGYFLDYEVSEVDVDLQ